MELFEGVIDEHMARSSICNRLSRKIIDEEWDQVALSKNDYKLHTRVWNQTLFSFDLCREDFLVHGCYANTKLLARYPNVVGVLLVDQCNLDGLLFKLREAGEKRSLSKDSSQNCQLKT